MAINMNTSYGTITHAVRRERPHQCGHVKCFPAARGIAVIAVTAALTLSCSGLARRDRTISELESELSVLRKRAAMMEKKNALLEAENSEQKSALRTLRNDYAVLKGRSEARIKDLSEMNTRLKADYAETSNRLSGIIAALEKTIAERNEDLSRKEAAVQDLRALASNQKAELAVKNDDIAQYGKRVKDLAFETERIRINLEKNELLLKERDAMIAALKNDIDALKAALARKSSEAAAVQIKLDTLESKEKRK